MIEPLLEAATLTGEVFEIQDGELAAAEATRKQMTGAIRVVSAWAVEPVSKILALMQLTPNWDGYNSPAVPEDVAMIGIGLINRIATFVADDFPEPSITPGSGGGLVLDWRSGSRELGFWIQPDDHSFHYLQSDAGEPFYEDSVALSSVGRLRELFGWLHPVVAAAHAA
jgi:hypothetical protein